jgi:hypothetical protein
MRTYKDDRDIIHWVWQVDMTDVWQVDMIDAVLSKPVRRWALACTRDGSRVLTLATDTHNIDKRHHRTVTCVLCLALPRSQHPLG